jgi:hypothetical protein
VDFEAKAREVCRALGASAPRPEAVALVADALRAAALDEGARAAARAAARAEMTRLLAEVKARALKPPRVVDYPEAVPWGTPAHPNPVADIEAVAQTAVDSAERYGPSSLRPLYGPWRAQRVLLERLLWLLGLSEGERRFVAALADDAVDFATLEVFADWLEDEGRTADGARVRRLVPRDGDVIVVRHPPGPRHEAHCATVRQMLDALAARGVRVWAVTMSDDMSLETAPPDAMRAAGWVRAEDAERAVAAAIRASLPDD